MIKPLVNCLDFLSKLKENNSREWFLENRKEYESAKQQFLAFTEHLILKIKEIDSSIGMVEAKDSIFRIHRDVRFSPNKEPYKTNMGAYIARGGRKSQFAGYYFHLEPNASFVSGGIYMAQPNIMQALRTEIDENSDEFLAIVTSKSFQEAFSSLGEESLKRVPKGFSSSSPVAKYLMLKHITPIHYLSEAELQSPALAENMVNLFREMYPLIRYLNRAVEQV